MNLKFIGKDGSMGLKHGAVYDVDVYTGFVNADVIYASWRDDRVHKAECPYSSPAAFAANWAKTGQPQKVVVRKKGAVKDGPWRVDYKKTVEPVKHGRWRVLLAIEKQI